MPRPTGYARLAQALRAPRQRLDDQRAALVEHWAAHPWNFLTGQDEDGRPIVWTKDESARGSAPTKPFPGHREFLRRLVGLLFDDQHQIIVIDKSRQMYVSTVILLYLHWECLFRQGRRWLLSKRTEDQAAEMLTDKIRFPHAQAPEWFRSAFAVTDRPAKRALYPGTSSYILALAETAAAGECRGGSASGIVIDEAAFQPETEEIWGAATPMASKLIVLTTANLGNPGAQFFHKLVMRGRAVGVQLAA